MRYAKEPFSCRRGELTIRGFVLKPALGGRLPAVIVSHGFAGNTRDTKKYAAVFAEAGCVTVYFDFCGSGRSQSDGLSTGMSVLTEKDDLSAVLDAVLALPFVDVSRVILAGCSQGGLVSALLAAQREEDVAALILYYPAFCIPDDARRGKMLTARFDPKNVPESFRTVLFIKLGAVYALDAQALDPYREICSFTKPVLICHGTRDRIVNLSYAQRAEREYANAKLAVISGGDHGFRFRGFKAAMRATKSFLSESEGIKP
jgi:dienelactone hydrolase